MLVSVLVDRYQRVFARKLYIHEEIIDFHDYSDDENNDIDSRSGGYSGQLHRRNNNNIKDIENPDARAKANQAFEQDNNDIKDISLKSDIEIGNENILSRHSSRVHFIIGYVDDEKHETSRDLLETISSVVAQKQTAGDNIQLSIISDEKQQSSSHDVRFEVSLSLSSTSDDDDHEELTEIINGCGNKGNVLKKFQRPLSPKTNKQLDKPQKHL